MSGEKIDIFKLHKAEYKAGRKPIQVETTRGMYLAREGVGAPGGQVFVEAVESLYAMAYTIKMGRKADGKGDYTIGKLEGIYWTADGADLVTTAAEKWCWRLMIRTPEIVDGFGISDDDLEVARERLRSKKKDKGTELVQLVYLAGSSCVQMMHLGPYEKEYETLAVMQAFCAEELLTIHGDHHEIYLSDPRRVEAEKLKTILRVSVRGG